MRYISNYSRFAKPYSLTIGWLYPELMNIYGDRGNIICLVKRSAWRNINTKVEMLDVGFSPVLLKECDLLIMGGAQDKQQMAVAGDLNKKSGVLYGMIKDGVPGLYVCGAYQFLGNYYKDQSGNIIKGLGIFDLYTENSKTNQDRLIGNISVECSTLSTRLLGFENHGGRTYLKDNTNALGKVIGGHGNNTVDDTEGYIYKNSIGTYLHGPILPKNPKLADFLLEKALQIKYGNKVVLKKLDDSLEDTSRMAIAKRLSLEI